MQCFNVVWTLNHHINTIKFSKINIENVGIDNEIVTFSTNWYSTFKNKEHSRPNESSDYPAALGTSQIQPSLSGP